MCNEPENMGSLDGIKPEAEQAELAAIANDEKEIESRFFSQLEFGTAGLRGTMGVGLYRMNITVPASLNKTIILRLYTPQIVNIKALVIRPVTK